MAAAANLASFPPDLRFNLVNTAAPDGYPIAGATWIIVYKDLSKILKSEARANSLVDFIWWVIHDGQADSAPLDYGALPANLLVQNEAAAKSINGQVRRYSRSLQSSSNAWDSGHWKPRRCFPNSSTRIRP